METRQSDEARKVGEEVVGPIGLPRPNGQEINWIQGLLFVVLLVAVQVGTNSGIEALIQPLHWSRQNAEEIGRDISLAACSALTVALHWWRNRSIPALQIERGHRETSISASQRLEFWTGASNSERALPLLGLLFTPLKVAWVVFTGQIKSVSPIATVVLTALVLFALWLLPTLWRPILVLDENGATVGSRFFEWAAIERVEVKHALDFGGSFCAVQLAIFDARQKRLARFSLSKDQCKLAKEEELLAFIAARLGRRYEHLAPPNLDWL